MVSPLYGAIEFMKSFGVFDIILPFLLVFTVIFGILEKTKVFGKEGESSRKNLNAMVAFVIGFFVVAATQIVQLMQAALPYIMFLLVLIIMFMILFGSTMAESADGIDIWSNFSSAKAKGIFAFGLFIAIVAIVLGAMGTLEDLIDWIIYSVTGPVLSTVILLLVVGIFMWIVVGSKSGNSD